LQLTVAQNHQTGRWGGRPKAAHLIAFVKYFKALQQIKNPA
jgi:hypothetical protein